MVVIRKIKKYSRLTILFLMSILTIIDTPLASAKIREKDMPRFAENNVLYYDPCNDTDERVQGVTLSGDDPGTRFVKDAYSEHWDGTSCISVTEVRAKFLKKHVVAVQTVAAKYGLPWEAIFGQSFQESGGGENEVCDYNPLGMKAGKGKPSCGEFAKFQSYEEAWEAYATKYYATREARNKFPQDPYSYAEFIENGISEPWMAYCGWGDGGCKQYTAKVSSLICGIQKWAEENKIQTSAVTYANWKSGTIVSDVDSYNSTSSTITPTATAEDKITSNSVGVDTSSMTEVSGFNRITFYGPEASANGGNAWANATASINNGKLAEGQVAVRSGSGLNMKDVIYVEADGGEEKSKQAVNGRYFIVADAGPPAGTLDIFKTDGESGDYGIIEDFTIYKVESDVSWEDFQAKYQSQNTSTTASLSSNAYPVDTCENSVQEESDGGKSNAIIQTALNYAWPYQESDGVDKAGKCDPDGNGSLVDFDGKYDDSVCKNNAKPSYKSDTLNPSEITACNVYVATVMQKSGADPKYKTGRAADQKAYLEKEAAKSDGKWIKVSGSPQPGDVGVKDGHTAIYIGEYGGEWGVMAQASHYNSVPVIGPSSKKTAREDLTYFRLRDSNVVSGSCQLNSKEGEGCIFYCQGGNEDWANKRYGSCSSYGSNCSTLSTYGCSACGPTSMAMIISNLSGTKVLPTDIGDRAVAIGARVCGAGSAGDKMVTIAKEYGLSYEKISWSVDSINKALDAGKVIYVSGSGAAPFSARGHFVAIRGKTSDGKWLFFDSAHGCNKGSWSSSKTTYAPSSIISGTKVHSGPYAIYK